ncbi:MAG: hypothetical protein IPL23_28495 [Saprospiraceae bacterium]|nr:hypothetical protein [Saprospiraceae bacterium]MBK8634524.1 hypothetical protein [Saprospiraceae bacterium]
MTTAPFYKVWQKLNDDSFELVSKLGKECHMEIVTIQSEFESNFFGSNGEFIKGIRGNEPSTINFLNEQNKVIASVRTVKQFFMTYVLNIGQISYLVSAENSPFASITISQGSNKLVEVAKDQKSEEDKLAYLTTSPSYPLLLDCLVMHLFLPLLQINQNFNTSSLVQNSQLPFQTQL